MTACQSFSLPVSSNLFQGSTTPPSNSGWRVSATGSCAYLVCSHVRVGLQGASEHLHSHSTPAPSLSFLPLHPPAPRLNPEYFPNLPRLSLRPYLCVSHSKTVKRPPNRSGTLSVIMASVYCRFHAPPHHEPIFPHICTCVCICEHTDEPMMQPKCCMHTFPL